MKTKLSYFACTLLTLSTATHLRAADLRPVAFERFEYRGTDITATSPLKKGEYRNPILSGFYPDPSICRVGKDFYLINSTFEYFPGIPISHSRDLVNWKPLGHVIHRPEQLDYKAGNVSAGLFAPAISYHDGLFYVVCTMIEGPGNFVVTAKDPAGPWSDPSSLTFGGIDPSIFFDDDGRAWIVSNDAPDGEPLYDGHRAVRIQEFDFKAMKMIDGPRKVLVNGGVDISTKPVWIEGPHLYKRNGWYYLCCAEGGTGPWHSQVILRSKQVDGPYMPWEKNPILTQRDLSGDVPGAVTCTGHADLTIGPDGNWWAVFLGVRPYERGLSTMGRETFLLPVSWTDDGWPRILPPGERVPLVGKSPKGAVVKPNEAAPFNGSFTWTDDFKTKELSPLWIMLREPQETWWKVNSKAGTLELQPREDQLTGNGNPSFFARRVQHPVFSASIAAEVPKDENVSAGLVAFVNEKHYYFMALKRNRSKTKLYLERVKDGVVEEIAAEELPATGKIGLRIDSNKSTCSFQYKLKGHDWKDLIENTDATLLTSNVPDGMFLGTTVGPHVRIDN